MNVTRSDVLSALGLAVLGGLIVALVASLYDNPVAGTALAGGLGAFVGRLSFYSSRNRKAMSIPTDEAGEAQGLD